jgi:hypothetical protein
MKQIEYLLANLRGQRGKKKKEERKEGKKRGRKRGERFISLSPLLNRQCLVDVWVWGTEAPSSMARKASRCITMCGSLHLLPLTLQHEEQKLQSSTKSSEVGCIQFMIYFIWYNIIECMMH